MAGLKITEPGVYEIDEDTYHSDPCPVPSLSSSGARQILDQCPSRYWYERENPPEPTAALNIGKAVHQFYLLGKEAFAEAWAIQAADLNLNSKAGKAFKEEAAESGRTILKQKDADMIEAMAEALAKHPFAAAAFRNGKAEQSLFWRDEAFGIWRRARVDFLPSAGPFFGDLKTCVSAHPEDLRKSMYNYGYYQQAAWYLDGIRALGLAERPAFFFVFQEKSPPYEVVVAKASDFALGWGEMLNRKAMEIFADCLESGHWPGYADDVLSLDLPGFAESQLQRDHEAGAFEISMKYHAPLVA